MTRPYRPQPFPRSQNAFSQPLTASSSRPFLNMLNPFGMSKIYAGYSQANQSLLEEEEEEENREGGGEDRDLEAQRGRNRRSTTFKTDSAHNRRPPKEAGGASEMHNLWPNIQKDKPYDQDSSDDEVPQSFMIEAQATRKTSDGARFKGKGRTHASPQTPAPVPSGQTLPSTGRTNAAGDVQPTTPGPSEAALDTKLDRNISSQFPRPQTRGLDAYERALWNWVNVYNLDAFLQEVYYYYEGKGIYSIALARGLNLLTIGFVIGFSTFLLGCIDYSRIRPEGVTRLSDVVVERCVTKFSGFTLLLFILFTAFYSFKIISFVFGTMRLVDMYHFYTHLLRIPDADIQTISWPEVVRRIGAIREENPLTAISSSPHNKGVNHGTTTTAKLDAHDIANRIMRQENYLIALFNKELLDLRAPWPFPTEAWIGSHLSLQDEGKGRTLTRALEWNLRFCLMEYLFDTQGRVRSIFLKQKYRAQLIEGLKRRFIFMGILNAIFAPFIVLYLIMYSFFRYFDEYHKNPSSIGGRQYTPFARWKFREFNELPHLFDRRLHESYPAASMYIGQFPNEQLTLIMRFVAFIAGSFAAVLLLASILDPDLFLHFEVTPHGTVLFYLGIFTSVLAVARGMIPEDNTVFDPELLMTEVIQFTHYMPDEWKGMLHSKKVHQEFGELFAMKILTFVQEIVSVVLTPFVLWHSLPPCAPAIIDFFRDFSVHVEGRGYVCSFAEFNFHRHGNVKFGAPTKVQDKRMISKEGKMEKSFLNFKAANPDWNPSDPSGSLYLNRIQQFSAVPSGPTTLRRRAPIITSSSGSVTDSTAYLGNADKTEDLADRAQEYDRALKQSQYAAVKRRQGSISGGSTGVAVPGMASVYHSSTAIATAQTAILGDSQGSLPPPAASISGQESVAEPDALMPEALAASELGDSYEDGNMKAGSLGAHGMDSEEREGLEDDGVLKLLAQIYGVNRLQGRAGII